MMKWNENEAILDAEDEALDSSNLIFLNRTQSIFLTLPNTRQHILCQKLPPN